MIAAITVIGVVAGIIINNANTKTANTTNTVKSTSSSKTEETLPEVKQKEYTGYCSIHGKYRRRYVECAGDYNPDAKARAEAKAKECNESSKAVHGCTDRYQ